MLTYPSPKLLFSFYFWSGKTFLKKKPKQNISVTVGCVWFIVKFRLLFKNFPHYKKKQDKGKIPG